MPLNLTQQIHDALWLMLESYAPFVVAVKAGNYKPLKATTLGNGVTRKTLNDPASLPGVTLDVGVFSATNRNEVVTLNDDPELVDRPIPVRIVVEFVIRHDATATLAHQTPLEAAVRAGLQTKGRTLGIKGITRFTIEGTSRRLESVTPGKPPSYPTDRFRMVIEGMPMRSLVIAV